MQYSDPSENESSFTLNLYRFPTLIDLALGSIGIIQLYHACIQKPVDVIHDCLRFHIELPGNIHIADFVMAILFIGNVSQHIQR